MASDPQQGDLPKSSLRTTGAALALGFITLVVFFCLPSRPTRIPMMIWTKLTTEKMPVEEMPIEDREPSCPGNTYNYTKRTVFGTLGCGLFGWPSTGGVLIKDGVDAVELDFLRLDRFKESVRSPNAIEEDLFCQELRKIGAKWWRHEADENEVQFDYWSATSKQKQELVFGWPREGGVWVLVFADGRKLPEGFGRIHMAFTMEERCQVIKEYGGTFFANPEDCKHLKDPPEASYDEVDRPPERSCRLD